MDRFIPSLDALHPFEQWGRIVVHDLGESELARSRHAGELVVRRERHIWGARKDLDLPEGFTLALECQEGADGIRRWTPGEPATAFVLRASLAGQAILQQAGMLTEDQSRSYHAMRAFFQLSSRLGAYLRRHFKCRSDLQVTSAVRIESEKVDVLPTALGCGKDGRRTPWSVDEVFDQGREAARRMKAEPNDEALIIRLGLIEAARLDPLDVQTLTKSEIRSIIWMGLFDIEDLAAVDKSVKAIVTERLLTALQKHLDDPPDKFRRWFLGAVDNLVHQISKKKGGGGPVERDVVRQAILEITVDSFDYVADCLHVATRAFAGALPRSLNDADRELYSLCYFRPPQLGEIPLILLCGRFPALREGVFDLLSSPSDDHVAGTVLQLLRYLGEMSHNRRVADKICKRNSKARNDQGRPALRLELSDETPAGNLAGEAQSPVFASLLERRRMECLCATTDGWEIVEPPGDIAAEFEIHFFCRDCERSESVKTSRQELLDIERSLQ